MANNYKLSGDNYIDKSGNDSNDGLNENTPKKSVNSFNSTNGVVVLGARYETNSPSLGISNFGLYLADGEVILVFASGQGIGTRPKYEGFTFINAINVGTQISSTATYYRRRCKFINYFINSQIGRELPHEFCVIKDSDITTTVQRFDYINCILINNQISHSSSLSVLRNTYVDFNTTISYIGTSLNPSNFQNNNIQGILAIGGNSYAIQDQFTGTPQDNGYTVGVNWLTEAQLTSDGYTGTISGWDAAVATCINRDPGFNNASLEDFSLQADSPHIGRANDGGNIGGTDIANTVLVNQNGVGNIEILTTPEIDTSNPNAYTIDVNEDEGYVDIIRRIGTQPFVLLLVEPITLLEYDSDIQGGQVGNRNVPDSEPLTAEYPRKLTTTSLAPDTTTLNVTGHDVVVGEFVRVLGEDREVTAVTANTITVGTAFRAVVASGVTFQVGTEFQLGALRPNRLTYQLRVSTQATKPQTEAEWDNGLDPVYNYAGQFSTQEYYTKPTYIINGSTVLGGGDSEADPNITPDEIPATWTHERVWLRNNYSS